MMPERIAAAWATWHSRHGGKLGPGPAFREAIEAALAVKPKEDTMRKPDLINGDEEDIGDFVSNIVSIATKDHHTSHKRRGGEELMRMACGPARLFHNRMATGIYNNTRHTMELMYRVKAGEEI